MFYFYSVANDQTNYPPLAFYFKVLVNGLEGKQEAGFEEVAGLDIKIGTEMIQESENQFTRKLPKALQYANLVLKRGFIVGSPFMDWVNKAVQNFRFEPKMLHVVLMNEKGEPLVNWAFHNAYAVSVKISDLDPTENKYAIETLELAYDYYDRTDQKINF